MTLNDKLKSIRDAFAGAAENVYHYWRERKMFPCIVWQEDGEDSFGANNQKAEQAVSGTLDYFTKTEFDPTVDEIQHIFGTLGVSWKLNSVQYEDETNLIHYEWAWVYP